MSKTGAKSGRFSTGHDPRRGVGKPGRSGRKSVSFIGECGRITEATLPKIEKYLRSKGPSDAGFRWAFDKLSAYGKGLPTQKHDVTTHTHEEALRQLK